MFVILTRELNGQQKMRRTAWTVCSWVTHCAIESVLNAWCWNLIPNGFITLKYLTLKTIFLNLCKNFKALIFSEFSNSNKKCMSLNNIIVVIFQKAQFRSKNLRCGKNSDCSKMLGQIQDLQPLSAYLRVTLWCAKFFLHSQTKMTLEFSKERIGFWSDLF